MNITCDGCGKPKSFSYCTTVNGKIYCLDCKKILYPEPEPEKTITELFSLLTKEIEIDTVTLSRDERIIVGISYSNKYLYYIRSNDDAVHMEKIINIEAINMYIDESLEESTSSSRSFTKATLGYAVAGPLGAVIGGFGNSTNSSSGSFVHKIYVSIKLKHVDELINILFLSCKTGISKGHGEFIKSHQLASSFINSINKILEGISHDTKKLSITDYLKTIKDMLAIELISQEEFATIRDRIISKIS